MRGGEVSASGDVCGEEEDTSMLDVKRRGAAARTKGSHRGSALYSGGIPPGSDLCGNHGHALIVLCVPCAAMAFLRAWYVYAARLGHDHGTWSHVYPVEQSTSAARLEHARRRGRGNIVGSPHPTFPRSILWEGGAFDSETPLLMNTDVSFGEVRSLLRTPSRVHWLMLAERISRWPDRDEREEVILPYCRDVLRQWPDHLRCAQPNWLQALYDGPRVHPALHLTRHITFTDRTLSHDVWKQITELDCWGELHAVEMRNFKFGGARGLTAFLAGPISAQLRRLNLYEYALDDRLFDALLRDALMMRLEALGLERMRITRARLDRLVARQKTSSIHLLNLRDNNLDTSSLAALEGTSALEGLLLGARPDDIYYKERHSLANQPDPAGLAHLFDALPALHACDLTHLDLSDRSLRAILSARPARLRRLDLRGNAITGEGVRSLVSSPMYAQLGGLDLWYNPIGAAATPMLLDVAGEAPMTELYMAHTEPDEVGVATYASFARSTYIEVLDLSDNALGDSIVEHLLHAQTSYPALRDLRLANNFLRSGVLIDLLKSPLGKRLRRLDLRSNTTNVTFFEALLEAHESLHLDDLRISSYARASAMDVNLAQSPLESVVRQSHYAGDGPRP